MSIKAINWATDVCARLGTPPKHRLILFSISKHHHDKTGACFPSYETIARETGHRRRGVIEAVNDLEANGLLMKQLRRVNGHQGSNNFVLFGRPRADKWIPTRVQKKAPCYVQQDPLVRVRTGALDRDYYTKGTATTDQNLKVNLPVPTGTGGCSNE